MLSENTFDYIRSLITLTQNSIMAQKMHLDHQIKLLPQHRVVELTEDQMREALSEINLELAKIGESLNEFDYEQKKNAIQHEGTSESRDSQDEEDSGEDITDDWDRPERE